MSPEGGEDEIAYIHYGRLHLSSLSLGEAIALLECAIVDPSDDGVRPTT